MASVQIRVAHALGRAEARARIQKATVDHAAQVGKFVKSLTWTESGAEVVGEGFEGSLAIGDTEVTGEVELGWKLSFFPLKVQRDGEAWLSALLR